MRRIRGATGPFIGFENYRQVFKDDVFWQALRNNGLLLLAVPILVVLSILIAVLLYEQVRGWRFYRTLFFAPYIFAIPVIGIVFSNMLALNGAVNQLLRAHRARRPRPRLVGQQQTGALDADGDHHLA